MSDEVETSSGPPESFGWQRRPDLDTPTGTAWERPDGQVWLTPKNGPAPVLVRIRNMKELINEYRNNADKTT